MNRSNVGNVITNGMQILSVGATTASRTLGKADQTLNNLTKQERQDYYKMKSDKIRDETNQYNSGGASATQHLSQEELTKYRQVQANDIRKRINSDEGFNEDIEDIDSLMSGLSFEDNSPQISSIKQKINSDSEYLRKRNLTRASNGRFMRVEDTKNEGGQD